MIICEDNAVEPRGRGGKNLPGLWEVSEAIIGQQQVAPSPIHDPAIYEIPHELTIEGVVALEDKFADAIQKAKEAGYDGVEMHGANGNIPGPNN